MHKIAVLLIAASILATSCTWRDCARTTAYAVGSTAVLLTGNADGFGVNENAGGQIAEGFVDTLFDAANATE